MALRFDTKLEGQKQLEPKTSFASWGRKLLIGGLIILNLAGCAPINYNIRPSIDPTRNEEASKVVSAEKRVFYNGRYYTYKIEAKGDYIYVYWNGVLSERRHIFEFIDENSFGGKFEVKQFIFGNPSIMWIGIDARGNYGFVIQNKFAGYGVELQSIKSELPVKKMEELGIRLETKYDEERRIYTNRYYNKEGKLILTSIITENGKITHHGSKEWTEFENYLDQIEKDNSSSKSK